MIHKSHHKDLKTGTNIIKFNSTWETLIATINLLEYINVHYAGVYLLALHVTLQHWTDTAERAGSVEKHLFSRKRCFRRVNPTQFWNWVSTFLQIDCATVASKSSPKPKMIALNMQLLTKLEALYIGRSLTLQWILTTSKFAEYHSNSGNQHFDHIKAVPETREMYRQVSPNISRFIESPLQYWVSNITGFYNSPIFSIRPSSTVIIKLNRIFVLSQLSVNLSWLAPLISAHVRFLALA